MFLVFLVVLLMKINRSNILFTFVPTTLCRLRGEYWSPVGCRVVRQWVSFYWVVSI